MRINRLTISNFRGIEGQLELKPEGGNLVIVGPNGSGKSSVLEAVDFLMTGGIEDLSGEGMQSVTELRHGPHIDADPDDAWVKGVFESGDDEITIKRTIANRNDPTIEPDSAQIESKFESMVSAADRGLHLLSRYELLEFIASTDGNRSDRIRTLLDINNIQTQRLALDNAADNLAEEASRLERESESTWETLYDVLGIDETGSTTVLERVNELRQKLGAGSVKDLLERSFLDDIDSPSRRVVASPLLRSEGRQRLSQVREWISNGADEFLTAESEYRSTWEDLDANKEARRALERRNLIEQGQAAIDPETERCPLCLKPWDPDELTEHLQDRLDEAEELEETLSHLRSSQAELQRQLTDVRVAAEELVEIIRGIERFEQDPLSDFVETLSSWEEQYDDDPLSEPPRYDLSQSERKSLVRPPAIESVLDELRAHINDGPKLDDLDHQYNTLQLASKRYDKMIEKSRRAAEYRTAANDMETAHGLFIDARDEVLSEIYSQIEDRFEEYYTSLHGDESNLSVGLEPTETGLGLGVDFYDRGQYPPNALHSEGHQDSMSICLYFSLCDWLSEEETLPVMMLDDIVMSIDSDHRRPLAKSMASKLNDNYQLFIATHDDLWHRHLRSSGVVSASNAIQFQGWNLEDGPQLVDKPEMEWETVESNIDSRNISIAAHQTRRMAEWFLREACDRLDAKVPFKADSNWTLRDFKQGAISRYNNLISDAKSAEQSWGNDISHLNDRDDELSDISKRVDEHGGALNPNVHWNEDENEFANCEPNELRLAVDAYRDLYELLWCDNCNSCVQLIKEGNREKSVRCNCLDTNMNLTGSD